MSSQKPTLLLINNLWNNEGGVERLVSLYIDAWRTRYDIVLLGTIYDAVAAAAEKWQLPAFYCFIDPRNVVRICSAKKAKKHSHLFFLLRHTRIAKLFSALHGFALFLPLSKLSLDVVLAMKEGWMMKFGAMPSARRRIAFVHSDYSNFARPQYVVFSNAEEERLLMTTYDHVLCVSEQVHQGILSKIGDPGNLLVRYNPIPTETIRRRAGEPPPPGDFHAYRQVFQSVK